MSELVARTGRHQQHYEDGYLLIAGGRYSGFEKKLNANGFKVNEMDWIGTNYSRGEERREKQRKEQKTASSASMSSIFNVFLNASQLLQMGATLFPRRWCNNTTHYLYTVNT